MIMKSQPNIMKRRLLLVQKLLYENTVEQHPLTTFEILEYLQDKGIVTNRKTLKGDIDLMVESGMDIITVQSKPNRYFWGAREFEQAELKLLVDAVSERPAQERLEMARRLLFHYLIGNSTTILRITPFSIARTGSIARWLPCTI